MRRFNLYTVLILTLMAAGCALLPKVDSIEDSVAVGYLTIESVAKSTAAAYDNDWISWEETQRIRGSLQLAHDSLGQVRAYLALGLTDDADVSLRSAEAILDGLQLILQEVEP